MRGKMRTKFWSENTTRREIMQALGADKRMDDDDDDTMDVNPLRPSGNYMNHLLSQSVMLHFVFIGFAWFSV
jgi:hypothetical protein